MAINIPIIKDKKIIIIWNHSIIIKLLYSSFEIYKLCILLALIASTNLIYLIINSYIKK